MKKKTVPYHELPLERRGKLKLTNGMGIKFSDGRTIAAYEMEGSPGLFIKITSPQPEGNESVLKFRLTTEAAWGLCATLDAKLNYTERAVKKMTDRIAQQGLTLVTLHDMVFGDEGPVRTDDELVREVGARLRGKK